MSARAADHCISHHFSPRNWLVGGCSRLGRNPVRQSAHGLPRRQGFNRAIASAANLCGQSRSRGNRPDPCDPHGPGSTAASEDLRRSHAAGFLGAFPLTEAEVSIRGWAHWFWPIGVRPMRASSPPRALHGFREPPRMPDGGEASSRPLSKPRRDKDQSIPTVVSSRMATSPRPPRQAPSTKTRRGWNGVERAP